MDEPGDNALLFVGDVVTEEGPITVTGDFYTWPEEFDEPILLDSDKLHLLISRISR